VAAKAITATIRIAPVKKRMRNYPSVNTSLSIFTRKAGAEQAEIAIKI
jgi:hypothetical protein